MKGPILIFEINILTALEQWVLYNNTNLWKEIPSLRYSTLALTETYTLYFSRKITYHC
jgi:hypothetical protein